MEKVTEDRRPPLLLSMRRAIWMSLAVFVPLVIWALRFHVEANPYFDTAHAQDLLPPVLAVGASVLASTGAGTLLALAWGNWRRMRTVLWPNTGRIFGTVVMALLTPIGLVMFIPFSPFGMLVMGSNEGRVLAASSLLLLVPLWYPMACLVVSGVRSRWFRVAVFGQLWLAAYGIVLLASGDVGIYF